MVLEGGWQGLECLPPPSFPRPATPSLVLPAASGDRSSRGPVTAQQAIAAASEDAEGVQGRE